MSDDRTQPATPGQTPMGQGESTQPQPSDDDLPDIPGYELVREIGRGGMGVVYRAKQNGLNRDVAVKMLVGASVTRAALARFWAEAEVMAEVKHPNVVQVIELGEHAGRPFMAMEFVAGGSLADRLRGGVKLPPRDAAHLLEQIARGVGAAHDLGIVHRDLKPDNVLLEGDVPKVADFGIAKRKAHDLTQTNAMMGTPAYMAPEQAASKSKFVGPAADVWSLGVMLYECLAGQRPFDGDSVFDLLAKIATENPPAPRTVAGGVPRDLQTIVAKCLTREPELRYPTATDLADDLARFGRGEPIAARPVGAVERLARWVRRKPTAAAAYGFSALAVALALVVFVVFGFWREAENANVRLAEEKQGADDARRDADRLRGLADFGRLEEGRLRVIADKSRDDAFSLKGVAERALAGEAEARKDVERAREKLAMFEYGGAIRLAHQAWRDNDLAVARTILDGTRPDFRSWEWHYVHRLSNASLLTFKGHTDKVFKASFSPDGRRVVTASWDTTARLWDAATGAEVAVLKGHRSQVNLASFGPDGRRVVTAGTDGTARVWDAVTGANIVTLDHPGFIKAAALSTDGQRVATAGTDGTARVWDTTSGDEVATLKGHMGDVDSASFSPDGRRVVTTSADGTAKVWDAATGAEVRALKGHRHGVTAASFDPDGQRVVTAGHDGTARVWDAATGAEFATLKGLTSSVDTASFSPDGRRVVTASWDKTARVWDAATGAEVLR